MAKMFNQIGLPEEPLPFVVKRLENQEELNKLTELRCLCYGHHFPQMREALIKPQECDFFDSTVNIIAINKADGRLLGAIRTETNRGHKLSLQDDLDIPDYFLQGCLATATKFCIRPNSHGKWVRLALFKSFFMSLVMLKADNVIITARRELESFYQKNLCDVDLYVDNPYRKIRSIGNIEHRIYAMSVDRLYVRWVTTPHPYMGFLEDIRHPDIII